MLDITLFNPRQHRQFQHAVGPLLLARVEDAGPLWVPVDVDRAQATCVRIEIVPDADGIRLHTAGCDGKCICGRNCEAKSKCRLELPAHFLIDDTRFEIADCSTLERPLEVLITDKSLLPAATEAANGPSSVTVSRWFATLGAFHRRVASSQEFFVEAARAAVEAIGLDGAMVLRRRDNRWDIVASHLPHPELGIHCNLAALDQLLNTPRTLFHGTNPMDQSVPAAIQEMDVWLEMLDTIDHSKPDTETTAVVVSPLKNSTGQLIGAIYGFRSVHPGNGRRGIRYLEAQLIELLAGAVSEGIARLEREAEVDLRRALAEQALAASGEHDPQKKASERREVTLLFADLRAFSEVSNSLGIERTYELLSDVMDALTAAVLEHDGLILDYYGDGLAAMWNAPASQPDHPELACRAALRMIETLPAVRQKWSSTLADDLRLGIGVHTGVVQVGNAGSNRRRKYGPRGANVHLAHRVEAATKALGVPVLVTGPTAARLSNRLLSQRLCRVQLPGAKEPVELYGIQSPTHDPTKLAQLAGYEQALTLFERGQLQDAAELLKQIDPTSSDLPTEFLAEKIEQALGQQQSRRSTDATAIFAGPVISLHVK